MSEVFALGRRREGRGKCRGKKVGRVVENNSKEFSTNFIQMEEKEYNIGERGRKGRKEIGTTQCYQSYLLKGKGHGITQGRQGMC